VGPRHLRGPRGITRFYSVHTVALVGRGVATTQGRHKTAELLCEHFVHAWRWLGPPRISQMDNEMAATGGGRHPYSFSLVMRLHLLLGVHLLFIPPGEPGRNAHIESFMVFCMGSDPTSEGPVATRFLNETRTRTPAKAWVHGPGGGGPFNRRGG
jgi:hypothetical protein